MPDISIYQDIDSLTGFGPQAMRDFLASANGQPVTVRLSSQGGNVIDGLAVFNLLKTYPGDVTVINDGMALSIASIVMMAGDRIEVAENSWTMIHNPNNQAAGDGDAMREMASLLDGMTSQLANIYSAKSGKSKDDCLALMAAETWMTGPQAVEAGFADAVTAPLAVAASFDRKRFSHPPTPQAKGDDRMPATFADLKKAFPRAEAGFIVRCQERNLELDAARAEFDEEQQKKIEEAEAKAAAALAECDKVKAEAAAKDAAAAAAAAAEKTAAEAEAKAAADAKAKGKGVPAAKTTASGKGAGQTATARWNEAIAANLKAGLTKAQAVRSIVNESPELQAEYLAEFNTSISR